MRNIRKNSIYQKQGYLILNTRSNNPVSKIRKMHIGDDSYNSLPPEIRRLIDEAGHDYQGYQSPSHGANIPKVQNFDLPPDAIQHAGEALGGAAGAYYAYEQAKEILDQATKKQQKYLSQDQFADKHDHFIQNPNQQNRRTLHNHYLQHKSQFNHEPGIPIQQHRVYEAPQPEKGFWQRAWDSLTGIKEPTNIIPKVKSVPLSDSQFYKITREQPQYPINPQPAKSIEDDTLKKMKAFHDYLNRNKKK